MYSDKENVNILTSLLVAHGIEHAVVCAGSRNAPIVHNLNACPRITCHAVTDERSAGFFALGIAQATDKPVVVCVTSGTAVLNVAPAAAEATMQHNGIIVVSADRPEAWIGQLDGQTMPQNGALDKAVSKTVHLPEPHDDITRWHCNRLVNEALIEAAKPHRPSVHINVPITEPLFNFTTPALPEERKITLHNDRKVNLDALAEAFSAAERPMVVIGQLNRRDSNIVAPLEQVRNRAVVLKEPLSPMEDPCHPEEVLSRTANDPQMRPDFVLYIGEMIVSKRLRHWLRTLNEAEMWAVSADGDVHDTMMHTTAVVQCSSIEAVEAIAMECAFEGKESDDAFIGAWRKALAQARNHAEEYRPAFSSMLAVKDIEDAWQSADYPCHMHYGNSNAVRLACIYADHLIYCNRGINGIEGNVSTAAGFAAVSEGIVLCTVGDLSFFYDQNALWNTQLPHNLRIMVLNNGGGAIFSQLPGLEKSDALGIIAAKHSTSAEGACSQHNVEYRAVRDAAELKKAVAWLADPECDRTRLVEVFTSAEKDVEVIKNYYKSLDITTE